MDRRHFLKTSGAAAFLAGYPVHGHTADLPPGRIALIVLEGGLDGLTAVPPIGDPSLERQRRGLIASNPLSLNPFFALHPSLKNFASLLSSDDAAIVHAAAFPYTRRSHFEGQNVVETGMPTPFSASTGWLGRAMDIAGIAGRAMAIDTPLVIRGATSLDSFYPANINGAPNPEARLLKLLAAAHGDDLVGTNFMAMLSKASEEVVRVRHPEGLALAAGKAMRLDDGPRVSVIRVPEFDTHANQGSDSGRHPDLLALVDRIFAAYKQGLGPKWADTIILTVTEFGRTVKENGSAGTEHGYGSAGLLAGGLLPRARIVANWPGLADADLFEKRDLYATLDYRSVCAACVEAALGLDHGTIADRVFNEPGLKSVYDYLFV